MLKVTDMVKLTAIETEPKYMFLSRGFATTLNIGRGSDSML